MDTLPTFCQNFIDSRSIAGVLLDDGALYSLIGLCDLLILLDQLVIGSEFNILPIPRKFTTHIHWQYGTGEHASKSRLILGSYGLKHYSDSSHPVLISHLVLDGASECVIGRNVTQYFNILHTECNTLEAHSASQKDYISLIESRLLSCIPI